MNPRFLLPLLALCLAGLGCSAYQPPTAHLTLPPQAAELYSASLSGPVGEKEMNIDFVRGFDAIRGSFRFDGTTGHIYGTVTSTGELTLLLYKTIQEDMGVIRGDWKDTDFIGTYTPEKGTPVDVSFKPRKEDGVAEFAVMGTRAEDKREDGSMMCSFSFAYPVVKNNAAANREIRMAFGLLSKPSQGEGEPSIDTTPDDLKRSFLETCNNDIEDMMGDASTAEFARELAYEFQTTFSMELNQGGLLSILTDTYVYEGGAHGMPGINGLTLDVASGQKLVLGDLIKRDSLKPLMQSVRRKLLKDYSDALFAETKKEFDVFVADKKPATETELVSFSGLDHFYLTQDSVVFYWNVYEIAPYLAGQLMVEMPFAEIQDKIRKDSAPMSSLSK